MIRIPCSIAGGMDSILGWETKIPQAEQYRQKKEKKKKKNQSEVIASWVCRDRLWEEILVLFFLHNILK